MRITFFIAGIVLLTCSLNAQVLLLDSDAPPYSIHECLTRAEELFKSNNFAEAVVFYYEGLLLAQNLELQSRLHFRLGECLEALRKFEFATYHYKIAVAGKLPELLVSRAIMKLEHLPEQAQTEEATRLFSQAMDLYRKRDLRSAIDKYLLSLRLKPALMAKTDGGLIDDAIQYLTFLTEAKDKEPERLMKLATLLELRGDLEKSVEVLQQLVIIYPDSDEARLADAKLISHEQVHTTYIEPVVPHKVLREALTEKEREVYVDSFDFRNPGIISRQLDYGTFTFRAQNESYSVPSDRFELFLITLGGTSEQRDFHFSAHEGIDTKELVFDTKDAIYKLNFDAVNQTQGYIKSQYSQVSEAVTLFSYIRVTIRIIIK